MNITTEQDPPQSFFLTCLATEQSHVLFHVNWAPSPVRPSAFQRVHPPNKLLRGTPPSAGRAWFPVPQAWVLASPCAIFSRESTGRGPTGGCRHPGMFSPPPTVVWPTGPWGASCCNHQLFLSGSAQHDPAANTVCPPLPDKLTLSKKHCHPSRHSTSLVLRSQVPVCVPPLILRTALCSRGLVFFPTQSLKRGFFLALASPPTDGGKRPRKLREDFPAWNSPG